jgi:hypothetical protein
VRRARAAVHRIVAVAGAVFLVRQPEHRAERAGRLRVRVRAERRRLRAGECAWRARAARASSAPTAVARGKRARRGGNGRRSVRACRACGASSRGRERARGRRRRGYTAGRERVPVRRRGRRAQAWMWAAVGVSAREPAAARSWRATSAVAPATRDVQTHRVRTYISASSHPRADVGVYKPRVLLLVRALMQRGVS